MLSSPDTKEERVCIRLSSLSEKKQEIKTKISNPKIKPKSQKTTPQKQKIKENTVSRIQKTSVKIVSAFKEKDSSQKIVSKKNQTKEKEQIIRIPKQMPQEEYMNENLEKIVVLLQENLYYPRRARKRALQGEVIVLFTLSKDAKVAKVDIISSPSEILSRGAIKTIENLSYKFPKPKEELELRVPITYSLQNDN